MEQSDAPVSWASIVGRKADETSDPPTVCKGRHGGPSCTAIEVCESSYVRKSVEEHDTPATLVQSESKKKNRKDTSACTVVREEKTQPEAPLGQKTHKTQYQETRRSGEGKEDNSNEGDYCGEESEEEPTSTEARARIAEGRISNTHMGSSGKRDGKRTQEEEEEEAVKSSDVLRQHVVNKVDVLVVDTAGFIKQVQLNRMGKEIYTLPEVIEEVRDKRARANLGTLPYEVKTARPEPVDIRAAFAKKTGDYASLSAVDMKVLALTHMWERLRNGTAHIRTEPVSPNQREGNTNEAMVGRKGEKRRGRNGGGGKTSSSSSAAFSSWVHVEDDSEAGWITPENLYSIREQERTARYEPIKKATSVGCFTTDYSMQNVCVQMGLNLLSVDGMVIKRVTLFTLSCRACFATVKDLERQFCPKCGNHTLFKMRYTVDANGDMIVHRPRRFRRPVGKKYTIPPRKGGKKNNDIILREDVYLREMKKRGLHRKKDTDLMDPDLQLFGKSRAHEKLEVGYGRRNPNASRGFRTGRKKKKHQKMQY